MKLKDIVNIAMPLIYLGSGIFFLIGQNIFNLTEFQKIGLGVLLILYGIFRVYRSIKISKEENDENKE